MRINLFSLAVALAPALGACSGPDVALATGGPYAMLDYARGSFGVRQQPDGRRTFTYVTHADAFDNIPADKREEQRKYMLAGWMGKQNSCPGGYEIASREEANGMVTYEGPCR